MEVSLVILGLVVLGYPGEIYKHDLSVRRADLGDEVARGRPRSPRRDPHTGPLGVARRANLGDGVACGLMLSWCRTLMATAAVWLGRGTSFNDAYRYVRGQALDGAVCSSS